MKKLMKNSLSAAVAASVASLLVAGSVQAVEYEVWAPDQSNSVGGNADLGSDGGYINIWEGDAVNDYFLNQIAGTGPGVIGCDRITATVPTSAVSLGAGESAGSNVGPCDIHDVFPDTLKVEQVGHPDHGMELGTLGKKSRVHGMIPDPQSLYFNVNFFAGGAGYVGLMDGRTKEAVALFRVSGPVGAGRSVHMSFWNADGSALVVANLHGKMIERINIVRDQNGNINEANFDRSASLAFADVNSAVPVSAYHFEGLNGTGVRSIGSAGDAGTGVTGTGVKSSVIGAYGMADGGPLDGRYVAKDPANGNAISTFCMENGCSPQGGDVGPLVTDVGRKSTDTTVHLTNALGSKSESSNVVVCPIVTSNNKVMVTFGGGGLVVADLDSTPMSVVGGYRNNVIKGAGCGGSEIAGNVYLNAGTNAGGLGATKSTFGVHKLNVAFFGDGDSNNNGSIEAYENTGHTENTPTPKDIAFDDFNTQGFGDTSRAGCGFGEHLDGIREVGDFHNNFSGQDPDYVDGSFVCPARRDSHGMTATTTGNYIHVADRVENTVTAINTATDNFATYSLRGDGCTAASLDLGTANPDENDIDLDGFDDVTGVNLATGGPTGGALVLPTNDPAGDLMATGPNNDVLFIALRGPVPVTVSHSAQGSCPGVGIIRLDKKGGTLGGPLNDEKGTMTHVLATSNTVDTTDPLEYTETYTPAGESATDLTLGSNYRAGHNYDGDERSDIHGVAVRVKGPGG